MRRRVMELNLGMRDQERADLLPLLGREMVHDDVQLASTRLCVRDR